MSGAKEHIYNPNNEFFPLPHFDSTTTDMRIPKIIHQAYHSRNLPFEFQNNIYNLKAENPGWEHRFYDANGISHFIESTYGPTILEFYRRINPRYVAARADLFRYLVIYSCGGVYLDIKSSFSKPIDETLLPEDQYILANWKNGPGEQYEGFGLRKELDMIPGGEYQQWHIIASPGHPFLRAVILRVLNNIDTYRPWINGVGARGVLGLTGPTAYTLAIHPILNDYPHRKVGTNLDLGLTYSSQGLNTSAAFFYAAL